MAQFQVEKSGEWCSLGLILGLALFNVFVSDRVSGIECTLFSCADNTKLCGVVPTKGL